MQTKIKKEVISKYLKEKFHSSKLLEYKTLGRGWHGASYRIKFKAKNKTKTLVLRVKNDFDFSHDYRSDRASSFMLSHEMANSIPKHAKSIDVVGVKKIMRCHLEAAVSSFRQLKRLKVKNTWKI